MKTLITAALLGLTAGSGVAYAQTPPPPPGPMKADLNHDGRISRAEFVTRAEARFARLDINKDGSLTGDETRAGKRPHRGGKFAAMRGQDGPPRGAGMRGPGGGLTRMDTDGDGKVTRAEYDAQAAARFARMADRGDSDGRAAPTGAEFDAMARQRFDRIDTNRDGVLDTAELQAAPMGPGGRGRPPRAPAAPTPPAPIGA